MQMAGFFLAAVVQGFVSDKFGRRTGLIVFCLTGSVLFLLNGLLQTTNYYVYIVLQLLTVAIINASCLTHFVYGMELIGPNYRSLAGMLAQCFFSLGFMLLTPAALLVNKTAGLMYIGAAIPLLIVFTLPFLRESFRWQFANGMFAEGMATLKNYMKKCGRPLDEEFLETLVDTDDKAQEPAKLSDLLKSSVMMRISIQMAFIWIVTTLTYYKLAIGESSGNMLTDNVFSGLIEIVFLVPGAWCLQQKWCQRRWFLGILFFVAGVGLSLDSVFTTMFHSTDNDLYYQLARFCRLPGRGAITVVFASIFVYSCEVYPTSVRSTGLGFCSFCARFGGIVSPQIDRLNDDPIKCVWGPGAIVACLSFIACAVSFMCPETQGMKVLETMDEANEEYSKKAKK